LTVGEKHLVRIGIPRRRSEKEKRSRKVILEILKSGECTILKRIRRKGKGERIEAEKQLKNGRLHMRVSNRTGKYVLDIHFDPTRHFTFPTPPPKAKKESGIYPLTNCWEIRDFINRHVIPIIKKYRSENE